MKKYLIHFVTVDIPTVDDDGVTRGVRLGSRPETFDSKEEAQNFLNTVVVEETINDLKETYGDEDEPELLDDYEFNVEGNEDAVEVNAYYTNSHDIYNGLINSTIFEIVEVEF